MIVPYTYTGFDSTHICESSPSVGPSSLHSGGAIVVSVVPHHHYTSTTAFLDTPAATHQWYEHVSKTWSVWRAVVVGGRQTTTPPLSLRGAFRGAADLRRRGVVVVPPPPRSRTTMSTATSGNGGSGDTTTTTSTTTTAYQTITEGSVTMRFPADQASSVFYNPVQVQNRDLSILMITLYAEERAVALAVQQKKEQLKQERKQQQQEQPQQQQANTNNLQQILDDYRQQLNPSQVLQQQQQDQPHQGLNILDALAASGLRSLRYWKEIPGVRHVTINDLETAAVERAAQNCALHGVIPVGKDDHGARTKDHDAAQGLPAPPPPGIRIQRGDAIHEMYQSRKPADPTLYTGSNTLQAPWDVIDLDPYGSAAPFIDAAVQAVTDGGLLCVTCTDMAALGGSHPETCYGRYAALPIQRAPYLQEMALRIVLQFLATTAAKYGRIIRPRLSVGMDFYVRVFCTVHVSKAAVNDLSRQIGHVFQSTQCPSFRVVPHAQMGGKKGTVYQAARAPGWCEETGGAYKVAGPLWLGPLHDGDMVQRALDRLSGSTDDPSSKPDLQYIATKDRLRGLLSSCVEELPDVPLFYRIPDMARVCKVSSPPLAQVRAALVNAGYRVSGYHKDPQAVKTDAPSYVVWDILRTWCADQHPPAQPPVEGSAAHTILHTPCQTVVDWTLPTKDGGGSRRSTDDKVARFPLNPQAHWGPRKKAKRSAAPVPGTEAAAAAAATSTSTSPSRPATEKESST